ncbi:V-type ATP synthase subunit C [Enterococcus olivae]
MKDIQYSTVNTRIRTYEGKLLQKNVYERMLAVETPEEIFNILQETDYGDFIDEDASVREFEGVLLAEQKRMYETLYEISPDRRLIDLFTLKYDYQNLKVLVKEEHVERDLSNLLVPFGSVSLSVLKELVQVRNSDQVDPKMVACIKEVFQYMEDYNEYQALDIIFDNYYWEHLLDLVQQEDDENLQRLIYRNIDVFNISTVLRSYLMGRHKGFISAVLAEGGTLSTERMVEAISYSLDEFVSYLQETQYKKLIDHSYEELTTKKTLNDFDLRKDDFLMERLKERKIVPFGPTAITGYIYAKETEIKNLRILLIGKINRIPEEILRSRVRETYV